MLSFFSYIEACWLCCCGCNCCSKPNIANTGQNLSDQAEQILRPENPLKGILKPSTLSNGDASNSDSVHCPIPISQPQNSRSVIFHPNIGPPENDKPHSTLNQMPADTEDPDIFPNSYNATDRDDISAAYHGAIICDDSPQESKDGS